MQTKSRTIACWRRSCARVVVSSSTRMALVSGFGVTMIEPAPPHLTVHDGHLQKVSNVSSRSCQRGRRYCLLPYDA